MATDKVTIYLNSADRMLLNKIIEKTGLKNYSEHYRRGLVLHARKINSNPTYSHVLEEKAKAAEDTTEEYEDKRFGRKFQRMTFYYDDDYKKTKRRIIENKDLSTEEKVVKLKLAKMLRDRQKKRYEREEARMLKAMKRGKTTKLSGKKTKKKSREERLAEIKKRARKLREQHEDEGEEELEESGAESPKCFEETRKREIEAAIESGVDLLKEGFSKKNTKEHVEAQAMWETPKEFRNAWKEVLKRVRLQN